MSSVAVVGLCVCPQVISEPSVRKHCLTFAVCLCCLEEDRGKQRLHFGGLVFSMWSHCPCHCYLHMIGMSIIFFVVIIFPLREKDYSYNSDFIS